MSKDSITLEKSKEFAIRIVNLYQYLKDEKKEYVLSKQILKSGTSIGANLSEAIYGISKKDFYQKYLFRSKNVLKLFIGWNYYTKHPIFLM